MQVDHAEFHTCARAANLFTIPLLCRMTNDAQTLLPSFLLVHPQRCHRNEESVSLRLRQCC